MAKRGDVLRLKTRLGFAPKGEAAMIVVVQADSLNRVLPSVLAVPLDSATALYGTNPTAVPVSAAEAGAAADHVAVTTQLRPVQLDHLAPGAIGHVSPATLAAIDQTLKLILDLP